MVTTSLPTIPTKVGVPLSVAVVVPSNVLLLAVRPDMVKFLGFTVSACVTSAAAQ